VVARRGGFGGLDFVLVRRLARGQGWGCVHFQPGEDGADLGGLEGLLEVVQRAQADGLLGGLDGGAVRENDDGEGGLVLLEFFEEFEALSITEGEVDEGDFRVFLRGFLEGSLKGGRFEDLVALSGKQARKGRLTVALMVGNQNSHRG